MVKVIAFDVSETLQTGAEHDDNGLGQPMVDEYNRVIPNAYSILMGGIKTAILLKSIQKKDIPIYLVTNNGADLDTKVIERTLAFFRNYGIILQPEHYLGPQKYAISGSKLPRLEHIVTHLNLKKEDLLFFDDSRANVEEAQQAGFIAVRVKTATDLQEGLESMLNELESNMIEKESSSNPDQGSELHNQLCTAIQSAQSKYAAHYQDNASHSRGPNGWFSWLRHGQKGQEDAKLFVQKTKVMGLHDLLGALDEKIKSSHARFNRHSFTSYLLDEISGVLGKHHRDRYIAEDWSEMYSQLESLSKIQLKPY